VETQTHALLGAALTQGQEIGLHVRNALNGITVYVLEYQEPQPKRMIITTFATSVFNDSKNSSVMHAGS